MENYFNTVKSIQYTDGPGIDRVLQTVANKYIGKNPARPYVFRLSSAKGFRRNGEYRYLFPLGEVFPDAKYEQSVYAWAKLWSETEHRESFMVIPHSPTEVFINGERIFHSNFAQEKTKTAQVRLTASFKTGWNSIVLRFLKTPLGFGGEFGTSFFKGKPWHFLAPTPEREGQEGFICTEPVDKLEELPQLNKAESDSPVKWYPKCRWNTAQAGMGQFQRIFGLNPGCLGYGWTKLLAPIKGICTISGSCESPFALYLNGKKVAETKKGGNFNGSFPVCAGTSNLVLESFCGNTGWGCKIDISMDAGHTACLENPCAVKGTDDPWIYSGPFSEKQSPEQITTLNEPIRTRDGNDFWRADLPDMYVRPFLETPNFANWNYPVGVTLYGLLETANFLNRNDIAEYVKQHVEQCTEFYQYALWDKQKFGAPGIDAQIAAVDSLDDCGSFASTMLELCQKQPAEGYRKVADDVAEYISHRQARLPDGTLYRYISSLPEMKNTIWLDDLYMSVPFLVRYYQLTGNSAYLDDAASQFLLYREKMYIPNLKVMSHVYYTDRKIATGIPWGRGNGWVLFSLSELLRILPENHKLRKELLSFFRDLCEGYLALQDSEGMWHQVLNDHESYAEASCTSMFICSFARGVRYGWLPDTGKYAEAAVRGWNGLTRCCVDTDGNIYGICRGSGHSFTPRYYKNDLGWILNDTHGIGILLLAGVEAGKMLNPSGHQNKPE